MDMQLQSLARLPKELPSSKKELPSSKRNSPDPPPLPEGGVFAIKLNALENVANTFDTAARYHFSGTRNCSSTACGVYMRARHKKRNVPVPVNSQPRYAILTTKHTSHVSYENTVREDSPKYTAKSTVICLPRSPPPTPLSAAVRT